MNGWEPFSWSMSMYDNGDISVKYDNDEDIDTVVKLLGGDINDLQKDNKKLNEEIAKLRSDGNFWHLEWDTAARLAQKTVADLDDQKAKNSEMRKQLDALYAENEKQKVVERELSNQLTQLYAEHEVALSLIVDKNEIIAKQDQKLNDILQVIRGKQFKL